MRTPDLPHDCALVLQQVHDSGEEDFSGLAASLKLTPGHLAHIVQELTRKRLIISRNASYGIWIRLSARGKRLINTMWPESSATFA